MIFLGVINKVEGLNTFQNIGLFLDIPYKYLLYPLQSIGPNGGRFKTEFVILCNFLFISLKKYLVDPMELRILGLSLVRL